MANRKCAYCGRAEHLTKEEVFPKFLTRLHPKYNVFKGRAHRDLITDKSPSVRDVCQCCNNEHLSQLDNAIAATCRDYLRKLVQPGGCGHFEFDYHTMCRWIWKVAFNSDRAEGKRGAELRPLTSYMLGHDAEPPLPQSLFVGVVAADYCTPEERKTLKSRFFYPKGCRSGVLHLGSLAQLAKLGRFLSINSYLFTVLLWKEGVLRAERRSAARLISRVEGTVLLSARQQNVTVPESRLSVRTFFAHGAWSERPLYIGTIPPEAS